MQTDHTACEKRRDSKEITGAKQTVSFKNSYVLKNSRYSQDIRIYDQVIKNILTELSTIL
jgi:hypothetical protein